MPDPLFGPQIPTSLVICGKRFSIRVETGEASPLSEGETLGRANREQGVIALNNRAGKQSHDELRDTLLHEVLHVLIWADRLDVELKGDEEPFVARLTTHLLDTLRRNSSLVSYLIRE